jgi:hypothetical protein
MNLRALLVVFIAVAGALYPLGQSLRETFVPNYFLGMSSAFWAGICLGFAAMSTLAAAKLLLTLLRTRNR